MWHHTNRSHQTTSHTLPTHRSRIIVITIVFIISHIKAISPLSFHAPQHLSSSNDKYCFQTHHLTINYVDTSHAHVSRAPYYYLVSDQSILYYTTTLSRHNLASYDSTCTQVCIDSRTKIVSVPHASLPTSNVGLSVCLSLLFSLSLFHSLSLSRRLGDPRARTARKRPQSYLLAWQRAQSNFILDDF